MRRLLLIRHAATSAVRRAAFPVDELLDDGGRAAAALLAGRLGRGDALCSPALRARETAAALGLDAVVDPALDECGFGSWAGRTLAEVHAEDPEGAGAWMTDPHACPHGGESLSDLLERVGRWLDGQAVEGGRAIAVTHAGVMKAAIVRALGAPAAAFWQIDVAPLSVAELHGHDGRWTLRRLGAAPELGRLVVDMDAQSAQAGGARAAVEERGRVCDDMAAQSAQAGEAQAAVEELGRVCDDMDAQSAQAPGAQPRAAEPGRLTVDMDAQSAQAAR